MVYSHFRKAPFFTFFFFWDYEYTFVHCSICNLWIPQYREKHNPCVQGSMECEVFFKWKCTRSQRGTSATSKTKLTAEAATDRAIEGGFALAGPPINPRPSTLNSRDATKDSVETPKPFWLFFYVFSSFSYPSTWVW